MNATEKAIYNKYGIQIDDNDKLVTPLGFSVKPLLKDNNEKTNGKDEERKNDECKTRVWTFGILPTCEIFHTKYGDICGTCPCTCEKGYCTRGYYNYPKNRDGLAERTLIIRYCLEWFVNAVNAQLEIISDGDNVRIHDVGDFDSLEYLNAWKKIIRMNSCKSFWTYTKHQEFENAFDEFDNANIVSSVNPCGYNFGHIKYILDLYRYLVAIGEKPYICPCGVDDTQHCYNCEHCIKNKYVLFIEHSTEYKAINDPLYHDLQVIIAMQNGTNHDDVVEYIENMTTEKTVLDIISNLDENKNCILKNSKKKTLAVYDGKNSIDDVYNDCIVSSIKTDKNNNTIIFIQ